MCRVHTPGRPAVRGGCTHADIVRRHREIGECADDVVGFDVREPERSNAGCVDDPAAVGERQGHGLRGRMASLADSGHDAGGACGVGDEPIHQGGFTHPGMADQRRHTALQQRGQLGEIVALSGEHHRNGEVREVRGELVWIGQVALRQAQYRGQPARVRGHQRALDKTGTGRRIGQCDHDQQV